MADNEYEILPHKLLADLKDEVEGLKKKLFEPDAKTNELILEIESLKDSIHELHNVFQKALTEMGEEDMSKEFSVFKEKINAVISQNETIARGMIAISDKLEDFMKKNSSPQVAKPVYPSLGGAPLMHTMGAPMPLGSPSRMAPSLNFDSEMDLPPPPPSGGKRKGIF